MFQQILDNMNNVLYQILDEFENEVPTTFIEADFEVQFMKIGLALRNGQIDLSELATLNNYVAFERRLWKKLNDVD
ncbi:MAG: hypothetical protein IJD96_11645 [Lachnospiraceae bacterium]|nr:hypothetical protein [Lachnospiraceae bacterium]